jgi:hypothetical protein
MVIDVAVYGGDEVLWEGRYSVVAEDGGGDIGSAQTIGQSENETSISFTTICQTLHHQ